MPPLYDAQRRQVGTVTALPTGISQVSGVATVDANNAATGSLIADTSAFTGGTLQFTAPTTFRISPSGTATDTQTQTSSSAESTATASGAGSVSMSVGTVVGICVAVFVGLCIAVAIVVKVGSRKRLDKKYGLGGLDGRNGKQDTERRKSGRELWVRMDDTNGEKFSIKQTAPNGGNGSAASVVSRSITVKSGKSSKTFKSIGYGAGLGLTETFKTPELPPHLEFTDPELGAGSSSFERSVVPAPLESAVNVPVSWGGSTAVAENGSFLALKHSSLKAAAVINNDMASSSVPSFQTPPAVETRLHQWETAEVVSPDSTGTPDYFLLGDVAHSDAQLLSAPVEADHNINVSRFSDDTIRRLSMPNPFQDEDPFREPLPSNGNYLETTEAARSQSALSHASTAYYSAHTFAALDGDDASTRNRSETPIPPIAVSHDHTPSSTDRALAELIAALNITPEEARTRLSIASKPTIRASAQSSMSGLSYYSQMTTSDGGETINEERYRRFPLPPNDMERR